jgi:cytochrome c2
VHRSTKPCTACKTLIHHKANAPYQGRPTRANCLSRFQFEKRPNPRDKIARFGAMKGADFVWDKEKLDRFIAKPDEVVPGNNMKPYGGLTSAEDRAKVIVFLESPTTN